MRTGLKKSNVSKRQSEFDDGLDRDKAPFRR
jgi:hypothetical protein